MGKIVLAQDTDPEYDPGEYMRRWRPIGGGAEMFYGPRFRGGDKIRVPSFRHSLAHRRPGGISDARPCRAAGTKIGLRDAIRKFHGTLRSWGV